MSGKRGSAVFDFSGEDDYLAWMPVASPAGDTGSAAGADTEHPGKQSRAPMIDSLGLPYGADSIAFRPAAEEGQKSAKIPKKKVAEHQQLCLQVAAFLSNEGFATAIRGAGIKVNDLDKKTVSELEEVVQRCRVVVLSSGAQGGAFHYGLYAVCSGAEVVAQKTGKADLTGFANKVNQDEEVKKLLDILSIDYGMALNMPVPLRLTMALGRIGVATVHNKATTAMQLHAAKLQQEMQQQQHAQVVASQANIVTATSAVTVPVNAPYIRNSIHDSTFPIYGASQVPGLGNALNVPIQGHARVPVFNGYD